MNAGRTAATRYYVLLKPIRELLYDPVGQRVRHAQDLGEYLIETRCALGPIALI
jgi:hypothetical protein